MEKKNILAEGDLIVENVYEIFERFLSVNKFERVHCMTLRKDAGGEPVFHFTGFCYGGLEVVSNEGEEKRFIIKISYIPEDGHIHKFSSFGNVLHWNHIHRIAYEMKDNKLIIKYFCRGSKTPASFLVLQCAEKAG